MKLYASLTLFFISLSTCLLVTACSEPTATDAIPAPVIEEKVVVEGSDKVQTALASMTSALQDEVDNNIRSGFVTMIMQDGIIKHTTAIGLADRAKNTPMAIGTRFRIASMTKPITSVAILMLMEEGKLTLDDPVTDYIPAFSSTRVATSYTNGDDGLIPTIPLTEPITIRHLLTHTAGLGYLFDFQTNLGEIYLNNHLYMREGDLASRIDHLATLPLYRQPGGQWQYSYGTDVLGRVIEIVSGQTLEIFMNERILSPLKMNNTEFLFDETDFDNLVTVYTHNEAGNMIPFDGGGLNRNPNKDGAGWYSGGGGLVSTASDYMNFLQMLLNKGSLNGVRFLNPETIELMTTSHVAAENRPADWLQQGVSFGLAGWVITEPGLSHPYAAPGQFGWGGYYDTVFAISSKDNLAYLVLAQREPGPNDKPSKAQNLVRDTAYSVFAK